jgi:hypothetical protein
LANSHSIQHAYFASIYFSFDQNGPSKSPMSP